eukprot:5510184-Amphidinium_carterae.1
MKHATYYYNLPKDDDPASSPTRTPPKEGKDGHCSVTSLPVIVCVARRAQQKYRSSDIMAEHPANGTFLPNLVLTPGGSYPSEC